MTPEKLKEQLNGITGISITPFDADGAFDPNEYERNLRYIVDGGLNASNAVLVVAGSTGECGAMSTDDRKRVVETAMSTVGSELPIIAGCNSTNVHESIELARHAEGLGAAGIMALAPYYYPAKDARSIVGFYSTLSKGTDLGILIYNNIEVMGIDMSVEVIKRLSELPNVVGIKECTPAFFKMSRVVETVGSTISVVNGHGEFLEPYAALAGTAGFISSIANFAPKKTVEIWEARSRGDYATARSVRDSLLPYMDLAAQFSSTGGEYKVISLLKHAADLVGAHGGYPRTPSPLLSAEEKREIATVFERIGLI
ncbi:dihydrodipicolinate synthase family protein [Paramicrobacterium chengjingii]|uniref:Dihydrodipicolinate synthase family protein n=1 Tax=Paramicrobacterium chengjingii TaxID=2769067 RepID=A0ABX6YIM6_9MICO|nr:dihydrodipicolinate synthase family protein [Microbacterium chengjingii]QPZ38251.1 dihydrodipicolinate synthase family protein [Microbacterium chengjingii]